jgi:RNA polymerase sigma factor (sigma-70 family)
MPDATSELVAAARDGDERALEALISASMPLVYGVVGRALRGHADVDDVVQEAMINVVRGIRKLEEPTSYRSWLMAIVVRAIRDERRRRQVAEARTAHEDLAESGDRESDVVDLVILRLELAEQRRMLAEALRWLEPDDLKVFSLWWLEASECLERRELALELGVPGNHAAARVHRMRRRLNAAREITEALRGATPCAALHALAHAWDGRPSPLWRKRFERHLRGCPVCSPRLFAG